MSSVEDLLNQAAYRLELYTARMRQRKRRYEFYDANGNPHDVKLPSKFTELDHQLEEVRELAKQKGLSKDEITWIEVRAHQAVREKLRLEAERWRSIRDFWEDRINRLGMVIAVVVIFVAIGGYALKYSDQKFTPFEGIKAFANDFYANVATDFVGIVLSIFLITRIYDRRDKKRQIKSLIRQLRVQDPSLNYAALLELMDDGYFQDGSLESANFREITLLIQRAQIGYAKLHEADFYGATLENVFWFRSDFREANFNNAKLRGSSFLESNLVGSALKGADLRGVNFNGSNLLWVEFSEDLGTTFYKSENGQQIPYLNYWEAIFDETTILPNGKKWFLLVDLEYFTDPNREGGYWRGEIHEGWEKFRKSSFVKF